MCCIFNSSFFTIPFPIHQPDCMIHQPFPAHLCAVHPSLQTYVLPIPLLANPLVYMVCHPCPLTYVLFVLILSLPRCSAVHSHSLIVHAVQSIPLPANLSCCSTIRPCTLLTYALYSPSPFPAHQCALRFALIPHPLLYCTILSHSPIYEGPSHPAVLLPINTPESMSILL